MKKFKIWENLHEQWSPDDVPEHDEEIQAFSEGSAAVKYAEAHAGYLGDTEMELIVQGEDGAYHEVTVEKTWDVSTLKKTSLAALCEP